MSPTAATERTSLPYRGEDESDPLNQLVITAGLDRGQVAILRAYRKYRQRIGSRFTEGYQNDVLVANSPITAKLVRYFELRFDPDIETDEAAERDLRDEILADLEEVASIDHDRILRNQLGAVDAENQLVYASDWPHWDFDLPSVFLDLPFLGEQAKRNILGLNAARLFNLDVPALT